MKDQKLIVIVLFIVAVSGCFEGEQKIKTMCQKNFTDPSISVIKFIEAENIKNYDEAKLYIDLNSTYGEAARREKISPEEFWLDLMAFQHSFELDNKFTGKFSYLKYDLESVIDTCNETANISFRNKNFGKELERQYFLKFKDERWIIFGISYGK